MVKKEEKSRGGHERVQTKPEGVAKLWRVIHPHPESKILHPRACKTHKHRHRAIDADTQTHIKSHIYSPKIKWSVSWNALPLNEAPPPTPQPSQHHTTPKLPLSDFVWLAVCHLALLYGYWLVGLCVCVLNLEKRTSPVGPKLLPITPPFAPSPGKLTGRRRFSSSRSKSSWQNEIYEICNSGIIPFELPK